MKTQKIYLQNESKNANVPKKKDFKKWANLSILKNKNAQITIRLVPESESQNLNAQFRQKDAPTNVLSFPYENTAKIVCGDLAICPAIVEKEAQEQGKALFSHYAHLTIHGILHLQGFDHETESDAKQMESLEIQLLQSLAIPNPYENPR